jgi:hypothetical protein
LTARSANLIRLERNMKRTKAAGIKIASKMGKFLT